MAEPLARAARRPAPYGAGVRRVFSAASELLDLKAQHVYMEKRLHEAMASTAKKECSAVQSLIGLGDPPSVGTHDESPTLPRPPKKGAAETRQQTKRRVDVTEEQANAVTEALPVSLRDGSPCRAFSRVLWETGRSRTVGYPLGPGGVWDRALAPTTRA